jgi:hypothetical protein
MARVVMIPGLAVRHYLDGSAAALRRAGHDVQLLPPLGWRETGTDLRRYAQNIARAADRDGPADLMIGMSIGTQLAVVAAAAGGVADHLLLISPTIAPAQRSVTSALAVWLRGENHPDSPGPGTHYRDWLRAGPDGIVGGIRSAITVRLEDELDGLPIPYTIVHGAADQLSPLEFAALLADRSAGRLLVMPDAPHSWPVRDDVRFLRLVDQLRESSK